MAFLVAALFLALSGICVGFSLARDGTTDLKGWTRLVLHGRKFLVARGTAEIERWPGGGARPAEPGAAAASGLPEILRVRSSARVLGHSVSRFDVVSLARPGGGLLEWFAWNEGKKARRVRLEEGGAGAVLRVARYRPAAGTAWILDREQTLPIELPVGLRDLPPIDPYGVMGRLGELVSQRRGTFLLVTRRGPIEVAFEAGTPEEQTFRLRDETTGDRVSLNLKVSRVMLRPAGGKGRTLLDMEGATELRVDADSGALLLISGHSPKIRGVITLRVSSFSKVGRPCPSDVWPSFAGETTLLDGSTPAP